MNHPFLDLCRIYANPRGLAIPGTLSERSILSGNNHPGTLPPRLSHTCGWIRRWSGQIVTCSIGEARRKVFAWRCDRGYKETTVKILLIDDAGLVIVMHRRALKELCPQCLVARDGEEGLAKYREHHPDVVICDLLMPNMDGFQFLEQLKDIDPDHRTIIVTADMQDETKKRVLELGAKAVLNKPYQPGQLTKLVSKYVPQTVEE